MLRFKDERHAHARQFERMERMIKVKRPVVARIARDMKH